MKKGKHVITANKMVLEMKGRELISNSPKDNGALFYYEASRWGIPVIHG